MSELINRVRHRIDTTENWVSANPILKEGEMGLEKTPEGLRLFKVGDGVNPWMDLEYISGPRGPQGPEGNMPARFSAHTNLKATTDDYGHVLLDEFSPKGFSIAAPGGYGIGVEGGSPILGGTDLDTLTRPGFYSSASEDVSSSLSNCPTAKAFDFVVSSTSYGPRQELHEVNNGKAFWRNKKSSTEFHPWQVLPTGITDSTSIESSVIAASATAVKVAYDIGAGAAALAAQANASAEAAAGLVEAADLNTIATTLADLKTKTSAATETTQGIMRQATPSDMIPGATLENGPAVLCAGSEALEYIIPACFIGSLFPHTASANYVPLGCVRADAAEYTRALFPTFYDEFLVKGKLSTCTYSEYTAQVALTGNCAKYALDETNQKFKVPLMKDGDSVTNASTSSEVGKSYLSGLPNFGGFPGMTIYGNGSNGGFYPVPDAPLSYVDIGGGRNSPCQSVLLSGSKSNIIYGRSNTVTDEQIRVRWFILLASGANSKSIIDWSNYMSALDGKIDTDLINITKTGTTAIAHYASPSVSGKIAMSGPATTGGQTPAMPSSGWLQVYGNTSAVNGSFSLQTYSQVQQSAITPAAGMGCYASVRVAKGEKVTVGWSYMVSLSFYFTPDKGANT